ncbi:hypothetical protein GGR57DRAFT_517391 [Xylariaceae sp. FL1272]|nr:hypothetical protein GGR57DRAFT_517391 [Xylariaceae sp. FL1272]
MGKHAYENRRPLGQRDFATGTRICFSSDKADDSTIRSALIGDISGKAEHEVVHQVSESLTRLYDVCLGNRSLALTSHLGGSYWNIVSQQWQAHAPLEARQVRAIVEFYTDAREQAIAKNWPASTQLSQRATNYIAMCNQIRGVPPPQELSLALRPTQASQATEAFQDLTLSRDLLSGTAPVSFWPPGHLNAKEVEWVTDPPITGRLSRVSYLTDTDKAALVVPNGYTHPVEIAKFLGITALFNQNPAAFAWSLYMRPIAFMTTRQKKDWWDPTGSASKFYDTVGNFVNYANDKFSTTTRSSRHTVIGFFSYWPHADPKNYMTVNTTLYQSRAEQWVKECPKYGILVFLIRDMDDRLVMVIYDHYHMQLRNDNDPNPREWQVKRDICKQLAEVFDFDRVYHGGDHSAMKWEDGKPAQDLVGHSLTYLWEIVNHNIRNSEEYKLDEIWQPDAMKNWHIGAFKCMDSRSFERYLHGSDKALEGEDEQPREWTPSSPNHDW